MNVFQTLFFAMLTGLTVQAQTVQKTMKRLPDTGQTTSYTSTFGEDNDYLIHPPGYLNNQDGTITDTVTGLMWQRIDGGEMTIEKALNYVDTLTLGGYTNWRLPSAKESFSILSLDKQSPAQEVVFFPDTDAEYWWTAELLFNNAAKIWVTNAGGGIGPHLKTETISAGGTKRFHARAVRDVSMPSLVTHFTDNGNGTITDHLTNLVWEKLPTADTLNWEQAIAHAEALVLGGYNDWRLPNIKELESINDESRNAPSVDINFFPMVKSARYWSATTQKTQNTGNAWFNDFQNFGITSYFAKTKGYNVICVRGGQADITGTQTLQLDKESIQFFPNPAHDFLTLERSGMLGDDLEIALYNLEGQGVITTTWPSENAFMRLDLCNLPSGVYVVKISNEQAQICKKIVLEK